MRLIGALPIQKRIVLLVGLLALAMAISTAGGLYLTHRQADALFRHTQSEHASFYGTLLTLRGARMKAITFDYTYWDDMVTFVRKPTKKWASDNLDSALGTYDVDILWVFDKSMHQVYCTSGGQTLNLKTAPLTPASRRFIIHSGPFYRFFVRTSDGLMEVYGGSIHPSDDVAHTGPAMGYLFVGRIWDPEYLSEIRGMTGSRSVKLVYASDRPFKPVSRTEYDTLCRSWSGNRIATVALVSDDPATALLEKSSTKFAFIMIGFCLIILGVISACLHSWVSRPLGLLSKAMSMHTMTIADDLLLDRAEIGSLANLVADFFKQRAELKAANDFLEARVKERTAELSESNTRLEAAYQATIEGWSRALDLRDHETEGHSRRVTSMTLMLARSFGLDEAEILNIEWGAMLHDIGKMGVPDNILLKQGPLTDEEWKQMRRHPQLALEMLKPITFLHSSLEIPYCHHEKWDGSGYPLGLKEEQIPLSARIFAIADVWDALLADRPYRPAWPLAKVREHCRQLSGSHFDPRVAERFLDLTETEEIVIPWQLAA